MQLLGVCPSVCLTTTTIVTNPGGRGLTRPPHVAAVSLLLWARAFQFRDSNRFDSLCESIRLVKKSAFRFTSCHAVFSRLFIV